MNRKTWKDKGLLIATGLSFPFLIVFATFFIEYNWHIHVLNFILLIGAIGWHYLLIPLGLIYFIYVFYKQAKHN
jgi:hypothetical protein